MADFSCDFIIAWSLLITFFKKVEKISSSSAIEKLNMDLQANRDILYDYAKNTTIFSKIAMYENADFGKPSIFMNSFNYQHYFFIIRPIGFPAA